MQDKAILSLPVWKKLISVFCQTYFMYYIYIMHKFEQLILKFFIKATHLIIFNIYLNPGCKPHDKT